MIALAADHLGAFRKGAAALPETLRPAFLPMALVPDYLKRLSIKGPRALAEMTDMPAWRRHWVLFRAALRGW
jgi:phytoene synthase